MSTPARRPLVAIDGSDQARYAFQWFLDNVYRQGDFVLLAHCAEYNVNVGLIGVNVDVDKINQICAEIKKKGDEIDILTNSFTEELRQKSIQNKLVFMNSDRPGEAIAKAAKEEGATHIIMGTRGLGTIRRTLLGSVSEYLVHHSDCPITVVRKP